MSAPENLSSVTSCLLQLTNPPIGLPPHPRLYPSFPQQPSPVFLYPSVDTPSVFMHSPLLPALELGYCLKQTMLLLWGTMAKQDHFLENGRVAVGSWETSPLTPPPQMKTGTGTFPSGSAVGIKATGVGWGGGEAAVPSFGAQHSPQSLLSALCLLHPAPPGPA